MKHKKKTKEPRELELEEDEEEDNDLIKLAKKQKGQSAITIGDIQIVSGSSLPICTKTMKNLLKDRTIKDYLDFRKKKLISQIPLGVG